MTPTEITALQAKAQELATELLDVSTMSISDAREMAREFKKLSRDVRDISTAKVHACPCRTKPIVWDVECKNCGLMMQRLR